MEKIKSNKYKENDKKELLAHANLLILKNVNRELAIIDTLSIFNSTVCIKITFFRKMFSKCTSNTIGTLNFIFLFVYEECNSMEWEHISTDL